VSRLDRRLAPHAAVALSAAAILVATLVPGTVPRPDALPPARRWQICDVVRNLVLFAPLGASLAGCRVRASRAVLGAAALSALVELAQTGIPGRDASPVDWIANVAGAAAAFAFFPTAATWLDPFRASTAGLVLAASAVVSAVLVCSGILLAPAPTVGTLFAHHTPLLANLAPYEGRVLDASIDGIEIPVGPIADSDAVRRKLAGDFSLRVAATAGAPPESLAALVLISDAEEEMALLGPDREDLVFRFRSRGQDLGLEPPVLRLSHALTNVGPGDRLALEVRRSGPDLCVAIDDAQECGLGPTVADGWVLLAPGLRILSGARRLVNVAWLAALFLPLGYWGRVSQSSALACVLAASALLLVPHATGLMPTPGLQIAAAAAGVALGAAARRHLVSAAAHSPRGA